MPDLDGLAATKRLLEDETTRNIPVIAVTASAFGDTRSAATDAGCAAYLAKPVRAEALFAALKTHLGLVFVRGDVNEPLATPITSAARYAGLVSRLRDAIAIGAVSDLEAIVDELNAGDDSDAVLAQRLSRLIGAFDFDGVRELARSLSEEFTQSNAE
jgi:CheY-like chemotaxis protein